MKGTKKTIRDILHAKGVEKLTMLTAYDFQMATVLDEAGIDMILVGDSVGPVVYGNENTLSISISDMIRHTQAVSRASKSSFVVADMPFGSYQASIEDAVHNASKLISKGGAQAVKLEGGLPIASTIGKLVEIGIPVMAHIGLTPQSVHQMGGYRMQGKTPSDMERLMADARAVENAGAFSVVLECIQEDVAQAITEQISIPTIGIGSGPKCDGQVLVSNDAFGFTAGHVPSFVKPLADLRSILTESTKIYISNVKGSKS